MIHVGDQLWIEYDEGGARLLHKRIVLGISTRNIEHFAVLTPDHDVYVEECDAANPDIKEWWKHYPGAVPHGHRAAPPGVARYDFDAAPGFAQMAEFCALGAAKLAEHDGRGVAPGPHAGGADPAGGAMVAAGPAARQSAGGTCAAWPA